MFHILGQNQMVNILWRPHQIQGEMINRHMEGVMRIIYLATDIITNMNLIDIRIEK